MPNNKKMPVSAATDTSREAESPTPTPTLYHDCEKNQAPLIHPAYYAVLPAKVRYDPELRPNAKLLYAEITALANARGYCFATNARLAELFGLSDRAARQLISQLAERGYLRVEVLRDSSNTVTERRLYVDAPRLEEPHPDGDPSGKNFPEGQEKNFQYNITSINNIPPKAPQGGRRRKDRHQPDWKPERFEGFWRYYPRGENKQGAIRAWDRLKPSDELIATMAIALKRQIRTEAWRQGIGIPYASTWLNNARWDDVIQEPAAEDAPAGWADDPEVI